MLPNFLNYKREGSGDRSSNIVTASQRFYLLNYLLSRHQWVGFLKMRLKCHLMLQIYHAESLTCPLLESYHPQFWHQCQLEQKTPKKELILPFDILSSLSSTRNKVGKRPGQMCSYLLERKGIQFSDGKDL